MGLEAVVEILYKKYSDSLPFLFILPNIQYVTIPVFHIAPYHLCIMYSIDEKSTGKQSFHNFPLTN
jgi:hypothetical protein